MTLESLPNMLDTVRQSPALMLLTDVAIKGVVVLAAAGIATLAMRRASAAARHVVWFVAMVALLALPVLSALLPGWQVLPAWPEPTPQRAELQRPPPLAPLPPIDMEFEPLSPVTVEAEPSPAVRRVDLDAPAVTLLVWGAGVALTLLPVVVGSLVLRRVERRATRVVNGPMRGALDDAAGVVGLRRPVALLVSRDRVMPMTWGTLRPRIILPAGAEGWSPQRLRVVLLHELGHVKRRDCLTHLLAQIVRALHWSNPLAWVAVWRMRVERERACDDLVLRGGTPDADYARELLEVTADLRVAGLGLAGAPMARSSQLESRLREILDPSRNRSALRWRGVTAAVVVAALITVPASVMRAQEETNGTPPPAARSDDPAADAEAADDALETDQAGYTAEGRHVANDIMDIGRTAFIYAQEHEWKYPPDLGATLDHLHQVSGDGGPVPATPERKARTYLSWRDEQTVAVPEEPTPEWVNEHASYVYLPQDDTFVTGIPDDLTGRTIILHTRLDAPMRHPKGQIVFAVMADGHLEAMTVEQAERMVEESKQRLEAARKPGPATRPAEAPATQPAAGRPAQGVALDERAWRADAGECARRMMNVVGAIHAYVQSNEGRAGRLPPNLGATLEHVHPWSVRPAEDARPPTPADMARVFLCPRDAADVEVPERPTQQWVMENTRFQYLGGDDVALSEVPQEIWRQTAIVHSPLDAPYEHPRGGEMIILVMLDGHADTVPIAQARRLIEESKQSLRAARAE